MSKPKFEWTIPSLRKGVTVGIDECNYSPTLIGDCVVTALWLPISGEPIPGIQDSKKLNRQMRLYLYGRITAEAVYCTTTASVSDIAEFGVHVARNMAAAQAISGLDQRLIRKGVGPISTVLCDTGMKFTDDPSHRGITFRHVKWAGATSYLVGAASIVAKCYTDALFEGWDTFWPGFNMRVTHGSGSEEHEQELRRRGPSPVHRTRNYGKEWWDRIYGDGTPAPE